MNIPINAEEERQTVSIDFDGVIHEYTSGWKGADKVVDGPVPRAMAFLVKAVEKFDVCIFSNRNTQPGGIAAMRAFIAKHLEQLLGMDPQPILDQIRFPLEKPSAVLYIDDHGFQFRGEFPTINQIANFKTWNQS